MPPFKRFSTVGWMVLCAAFWLIVSLEIANANGVGMNLVAFNKAFATQTEERSEQFPDWLLSLDLSTVQMRQIVEIDDLLEQQLELILTSDQYSQWQASRSFLSNESWRFEDIGIYLSPYQQIAVEGSFQAAFENLLDILSPGQKQQLMQYLSEQDTVPEQNPGI